MGGKLPSQFETDRGSIYTLNPDNRYGRFKTVTREHFPPADLTVFMKIPEPYNPYLELPFLVAAQQTRKIFVAKIINGGDDITKIEHNSQVGEEDWEDLFVGTVDRITGEPIMVDASLYPFVGGQVYEEGSHDNGIYCHVGNKVVNLSE